MKETVLLRIELSPPITRGSLQVSLGHDVLWGDVTGEDGLFTLCHMVKQVAHYELLAGERVDLDQHNLWFCGLADNGREPSRPELRFHHVYYPNHLEDQI